MSDLIKLLPDSIANQIAAGEVIQRPASVLKELIDNAVDAGATQIHIWIKDSGKSMIHVQDNGSGMSPADARMCLERHATSKLKKAEDLFSIKTMGFRGEAMASIAAIAHMEIKTRRSEDAVGTRLVVEGGDVTRQEGCAANQGTSVFVKNLFYNVPARRKFLKSDTVEMRHLLDEFQHHALAFEHIHFRLYHNDQEVFNLPPGTIRNRLLGIFGKKINEHLVPVEEETTYVKISGYIGKPKLGRKSRGEQFLFVNQRFIRSNYLQHAIKAAYEDILPADSFPFYVLYLEIDPLKIDVNVHPTKQEIKFEDDRVIYNYLRVACRHALGKYSITPSLDFDQEPGIEQAIGHSQTTQTGATLQGRVIRQEKENIEKWRSFLDGMEGFSLDTDQPSGSSKTDERESDIFSGTVPSNDSQFHSAPVQLWHRYIVIQGLTELFVIDQRAAHERVLFETILNSMSQQTPAVQKLLWPETMNCTVKEAEFITELLPTLQMFGFDIEHFGHDTFIIHGIPAIMTNVMTASEAIEELRDKFTDSQQTVHNFTALERTASSLAFSLSRRRGEHLSTSEMQILVEQLMKTDNPYTSPSGRRTFITFSQEEIFRRFQS